MDQAPVVGQNLVPGVPDGQEYEHAARGGRRQENRPPPEQPARRRTGIARSRHGADCMGAARQLGERNPNSGLVGWGHPVLRWCRLARRFRDCNVPVKPAGFRRLRTLDFVQIPPARGTFGGEPV
jgi:hypothetical protein